MDQRARADASVSATLAGLKRALDCLFTTAVVAPEVTFSYEMQETMMAAARRFELEVKAAADGYAKVAADLEEQARANWPKADAP